MKASATLSSKGQVTIPKQIRATLNISAGDKLSFTLIWDGTVLMRAKNKRLSNMAGFLYLKGRKTLPVGMLSR
jgi:AbrB family looped-hinge helix DNA binding protein